MKNRNLPGERLAGLLADTLHKVQHGGLTLDELALFNQRKNPFEIEFERNENGHIVLTFDGLNLTGEQEIERLEAAGYCVSDAAKSCLLSTKNDGYNRNHRLVTGKRYKVAFMPTREIKCDCDRTKDALLKHGIYKYGYEKPLAGTALRIRELVSDEKMGNMGFEDIITPHDSIEDSGGLPRLLFSLSRLSWNEITHENGVWLHCLSAKMRYADNHTFAFLVSAS